MNEPSLEQRILEAAAEYESAAAKGHSILMVPRFYAPELKALLEEKNAEIARLHRGIVESGDWKFCGKSPQELIALIARKEQFATASRERDEWKRIAGQLRKFEWEDVSEAIAAYDALTGKGEPHGS